MRARAAAALLWSVAAPALGADNGLGLTPPMGWRSWNCYHADVTQAKMEATMDALANASRAVDGSAASLASLGYVNCGLDDNWQACGAGVHGSFHDASGAPIVNTKTFPDLRRMTDHGHGLGARARPERRAARRPSPTPPSAPPRTPTFRMHSNQACASAGT